ncbi:MAG: Asp-tRNA(Asn)/Glu-tRNA(Gln) amidotransferase subunit GatB [Proteobacteria bacterium]|nr:Asp-tRNA(Asn)/Glu-tRNA(Gln) amidotransferase subunit GatB [Pseudomonadota bacterium]
MNYEAVIGLEVHAQLLTDSKIFCGCSTRFGAEPNTHVCPVCMGHPGVLPVLNRKVVEYALKTAVAVDCRVAERSIFARKNYFYPDLPKGYQISQYEAPLAEHGRVQIEVDGRTRTIGLTRIHVEEDAGKLIHDSRLPKSYVDLNRTGVPLIEIVSEPDIRSPEEASAYLKRLRDILVYLEVCDGNMEEGSFRCDANVSIRPVGDEKFGTRTELKNMNSFRGVQRALEYEIRRQAGVLDSGGEVVQETRLWDVGQETTTSMRGKEEAHDYRYFPDPDLVPLVVDREWVERLRADLPELPAAKKARFMADYGLTAYDAEVLTDSRPLADYYERAVAAHGNHKAVANWVMNDLLGALNDQGLDIRHSPVTPDNMAGLVKLIDDGRISGKIAKKIFEDMVATGQSPADIVSQKGLVQVSDEDELSNIIDEILAAHPKEVEQYRGGKKKLLGFFVGQVMKRTKGQANPQVANEILAKKLGG